MVDLSQKTQLTPEQEELFARYQIIDVAVRTTQITRDHNRYRFYSENYQNLSRQEAETEVFGPITKGHHRTARGVLTALILLGGFGMSIAELARIGRRPKLASEPA